MRSHPFRSQIDDELIACSDFEELCPENGYPLVPVIHRSWKKSERRLLVVVESVDGLDIRNQELLSGSSEDNGRKNSQHNPMRSVLSNILDQSLQLLRPYGVEFEEEQPFAFGLVNFNAEKIRHMKNPADHLKHFPSFTARVIETIKRLKPTHVLVCGDTASHYLLRELESAGDAQADAAHSEYKRGWVFKRSVPGGKPFLMVPTLDLEPLYNQRSSDDDDDEESDNDKYAAADLLYFVTRQVCNLLAGRMLHSIAHVKPNAIYVDTIEAFDILLAKLKAADIIATDTETRSLANIKNRIYMAQFAISEKRGYCIPLHHPKSPFTPEEQAYIEKKLRAFLLSRDAKTLVTLNGSFDLRIYRAVLGLPIVPYHKIHEITAGEQLLDENLGLFARLKLYHSGKWISTSYQNLRAICMMYGNDFYWTAAFSKEERSLVGMRDPDDPDVLAYASMDCQVLIAIRKEQLARAANTVIKPAMGKPSQYYREAFETHVLHQMSNTVQAISHAEQAGSHVDINYLLSLMGKSSVLKKVIKDTTDELNDMPSVKATNLRLLKSKGQATTSLFGADVNMNMFNLGKREHKEALFFDTLGLKPVNLTDSGLPGLGKLFRAAYKDSHPEVERFETITKATKLMGTYVKGWHTKLMGAIDSAVDHCLRPGFGFFTIVTGRLNSFNPSLQQVPSRGSLAYYIKRMFTAKIGQLLVRFDYSAHEVRVWSFLSGDTAIASSFQAGLDLRRKLIQNPTDETRKELKQKGDFHIVNVKRFFGKWVSKDDPLRDQVKGLVFGVIYGLATRSLAKNFLGDARNRVLKQIKELQKALKSNPPPENAEELKKTLKKAEAELGYLSTDAAGEEYLEKAQTVTEKLFEEFPVGSSWLQDVVKLVRRHAHVVSPIGRVRRLWRVYTAKRGVLSAADRRAMNSPIQGMASELGCSAAFLILRSAYEFIRDNKWSMELMPEYNRAVHDANYFGVPYAMIIPFIHIKQHMATAGLTQWYKEVFKVEFPIDPELEIELCASEDKSYKWNWEIPELLQCIYKSLEDEVTLGILPADQLKPTFKLILAPWRDPEMRAQLQRDYPLLGVKNLDSQIAEALKSFQAPTPKEKVAA